MWFNLGCLPQRKKDSSKGITRGCVSTKWFFTAFTSNVPRQKRPPAAQESRYPLAERGRLAEQCQGHVRDASQNCQKEHEREGWDPLAERGLCRHRNEVKQIFKFVVKWWKSLRLVAAQPNGAGPYQSQHAFVVKAFNRGSVSSMACGEHTSLSIFGSTSNMSLYVSQAFPWIVQSTRLQ